ncbi:hypothetical protein [Enterobacter hormaechei]
MVELFSLSLIRYINSQFNTEKEAEVFLADSNDSQNAIAFSHDSGIIYWSVGIDVESSKVELKTVYLDSDYNMEFEETEKYVTLKDVIEIMLFQISQLKKVN